VRRLGGSDFDSPECREVETNESQFKVRPGLQLLFVVVLVVAICEATGIAAWLADAPRDIGRAMLLLASISTSFGWSVLLKKGDDNVSKRKWAAVGAATILTVSIATYVLYMEIPVKYFIHFHLLNTIASVLFQSRSALAVFGLIGPFFAGGRPRVALVLSGLLMLLLWNANFQHLAEIMTIH